MCTATASFCGSKGFGAESRMVICAAWGGIAFLKKKGRSRRHRSRATTTPRDQPDTRLAYIVSTPFREGLQELKRFGARFQDLWFSNSSDDWRPEALRGNWAPVRSESHGLGTILLEGTIPDDLAAGRLVRNGPNPRWVRPGMASYHPFEGDGMLHVVDFSCKTVLCDAGHATNGAQYSNRWIRTAKWHAEDAAQVPLLSGMVDDNIFRMLWNTALNLSSVVVALPAIALNFSAVHAVGGSYVTNTNVISHAGETLALGECGSPVTVNLEDLTTTGTIETGGSFNAHPKVCPVSGELIWCGYQPQGLDYAVWDAEGNAIHFTTLPLEHSVMVHDIAVTERYTVFLDCPLRFQDVNAMAQGQPPISFESSASMRLGVLPRHGHGDDVVWVEVPGPGKMVFHVLNAFEENGEIVVIGCAAQDLDLLNIHDIPFEKVRLTEWRIDASRSTCCERVLSNQPCEFPRINEKYTGLPFRYGYAAIFSDSQNDAVGPLFSGFLKYDRQLETTQVCQLDHKQFCSEPVFVPRKDSEAEDDGYIMLYMHDEINEESQVLIYDARDLQSEQPICRLGLPARVPYGFHAAWIGNEDRE